VPASIGHAALMLCSNSTIVSFDKALAKFISASHTARALEQRLQYPKRLVRQPHSLALFWL